ncbi:MAG: hypothetical protein K2K97_01110, partial [Muribaculaceae bacterium]|nr:hypothetical protein [Muribaculaceae bacterium]
MKLKRYIPLLSALLLPALQSYGAYSFKEESALANGKWVKIEISETGLYSIPYSQLREMGFSEPENVGVYGKGGMMLNLQFSPTAVSSAGYPYYDDLSQITSLHSNDALIFWGRGTENVGFQPGTTASGPYFENYQRNIYSKVAYYFLSDNESPLAPEPAATTGSTFSSLKNGWGYVRHEVDLEQNSTNTGNLFWGESFKTDGAVKTWTVPVHNMTAGTSHLSYQVYSMPGDKFTLRTRCSAADKEKVFPVINTDVNYFFPLRGRLAADPYKYATPDTLRFSTKPQTSVEISIAAEDISADYVNLDYWILTYPKEILSNPLSGNLASDLYYFKGNKNTNYKLPLAKGLCAWDLSDPEVARSLSPLSSNDDFVGFRLTGSTTIPVVIFDPAKAQKKISGWREIGNRNIHGLQAEGYELLIVTVPKLKDRAEQLADLHRKHDNIKVLVVTPEEIYDEFSGGVPDPMAYRAVAKMLYANGLKNMLLLGPSMRNMLLDVAGETHFDHHIALQHSYVKPEESSVPAYEFYGVMADNPVEANLHTERKEIGIGLLSCETSEDCDRVIRKIERYMTSEDHAWIINETMTIGGLGDAHLHDEQAVDSGEHIKSLAGHGGMAHNNLIIDAYGKAEARTQFESLLDRGKIWNIYFGHGGAWMMGQDARFFTTGDLQQLKNSRPGVVFMGGCDFSLPDIRVRGLGEGFVLDSDYGMIAAILSTRTAWSSQNKYLGDVLTEMWLNPADKSTAQTIGEIFAKAKSKSNALNHLSFVLAADPAVKIPAPYAGVEMTTSASAAPGEKVRVTGKVNNNDGAVDIAVNGKVVLK